MCLWRTTYLKVKRTLLHFDLRCTIYSLECCREPFQTHRRLLPLASVITGVFAPRDRRQDVFLWSSSKVGIVTDLVKNATIHTRRHSDNRWLIQKLRIASNFFTSSVSKDVLGPCFTAGASHLRTTVLGPLLTTFARDGDDNVVIYLGPGAGLR